MTIVFTCLHPDYVFQISDRRMTNYYPDGKSEIADEKATKTVLFQNQFAFSFAGLGKMGDVPMSEWLALTIGDARDPLEALEMLRQEATVTFRKLSYQYFHEFVAVGWLKAVKSDRYVPFLAHITNGERNEQGGIQEIKNEFKLTGRILEEKLPYLFTIAGDVDGLLNKGLHPKSWWDKKIKTFSKRGLGPQPVVRLAIEDLHHLANINKRNTIGKNLLAVAIPKKIFREEVPKYFKDMQVTNVILPNLLSTLSINADGTSEIHAPIKVAGSGGTIISDYVAEQIGNNPADMQVTIKFLKVPRKL